jgi:hypothetical protein
MSKSTMTESERFFWTNAGYSYDPKTETKAQGRRKCATILAEAEVWASEQEMSFTWEYDDCPDLSWMTESEQAEDHEVLVCLAKYRDGSVAGALGGIVDADRTYRRVVEAEIAAEAQHDCLAALMGAI